MKHVTYLPRKTFRMTVFSSCFLPPRPSTVDTTIQASRFGLRFIVVLTLTDPVFLNQSPLAQMYSALMRKCSSSNSGNSSCDAHPTSIALFFLPSGKLTNPHLCIHLYRKPSRSEQCAALPLPHRNVGQSVLAMGPRVRALPPSPRCSRPQALKLICLSIVCLFPLYRILFTYFHSDEEDLEKSMSATDGRPSFRMGRCTACALPSQWRHSEWSISHGLDPRR